MPIPAESERLEDGCGMMYAAVCWMFFRSVIFWGWRKVMFQLSGFYCMACGQYYMTDGPRPDQMAQQNEATCHILWLSQSISNFKGYSVLKASPPSPRRQKLVTEVCGRTTTEGATFPVLLGAAGGPTLRKTNTWRFDGYCPC